MLPTTLITPCPPVASVGSVNMSSPARIAKLSGTPSERISATRGAAPLASFTPTMPGTLAQRAMVSGSMSTLVREGTLYMTTGSPPCLATASKWRKSPSGVGLL